MCHILCVVLRPSTVENNFLARLDKVQEELLYYHLLPLASALVSALALAAAALAKSLTLKFFM